ncbi:MAG TPA: hypothetical protein VHK64_10340 [Nocardioidaceae bacterium]|nr:hypothetical protein [Nocardioidaceae bacterium]
MASTVFFHVGLPKTGTTYLQTLLWNNEAELRRQGVLLPGESVREHLWASGAVREDPRLDRRGPQAPGAWDRLVADINAWPGAAIVSHEFFAAASADQAVRAMQRLQGAEVHVVVTARDTLSLVTARWQEFVKNGSTVAIDDYPVREDTSPEQEWDWGTLDLADVLRRWGASLPRERVHVLTLPKPGTPRDELWVRFARLVGVDHTTCDVSGSVQNESLGVVEVELLRRVNAELVDFTSAIDRGNWIRGYLAQGKLVPRRGEKFWPSPARIEELRERGDRSVDFVISQGYDVIGDVEDLRTPKQVPERRHPDSVTDTEIAAAGAATIAAMMTDVRRLTRERRAAREAAAEARSALELRHPAGLTRKLSRRVRRMWSRS